jgi:hypothetical protein
VKEGKSGQLTCTGDCTFQFAGKQLGGTLIEGSSENPLISGWLHATTSWQQRELFTEHDFGRVIGRAAEAAETSFKKRPRATANKVEPDMATIMSVL